MTRPALRSPVRPARRAFTLVELLVVIAILAVVLALLLCAVQNVRAAAARVQCANNLKQIGLALHGFETTQGVYPPGYGAVGDARNEACNFNPWAANNANGYDAPTAPAGLWVRPWSVHILPYLEQAPLYNTLPTMSPVVVPPPGSPLTSTPPAYVCPADPRGRAGMVGGYTAPSGAATTYGLWSYAGMGGSDGWADSWPRSNGMLYWRSKVTASGITDGTTHTIMAGERPGQERWPAGSPAAWGAWAVCNFPAFKSADWTRPDSDAYWVEFFTVQYAANGRASPSYIDGPTGKGCPFPDGFRPGTLANDCDLNHFWSHHPGGSNFVLADGSVRFIAYSVAPQVFVALSTRNRGEVVSVPD